MNDYTAYHLDLETRQINHAKIAFLPGDPGRVTRIAAKVNPDYRELAFHREYRTVYLEVGNTPVLITSTGIGAPSTAIAIEELAQLGVKIFIRIGTTGAIQPHINLGDMIITTGAVRLDGASSHYAPIEYPAVADWQLVGILANTAREAGIPAHCGITVSSDTFYPGQERYDTFTHYVIKRFQGSLEEWKHLNVLNYEMEASTLYVMASAFGLKAVTVSGVIAHRLTKERCVTDEIPATEAKLALLIQHSIPAIQSLL
ncbi:MAG: uridine phosphorylase [Candidatus Delongbacteria bacterium]|nr:uridine phosphorylase [Candidatus Delongbacteria bacterium]